MEKSDSFAKVGVKCPEGHFVQPMSVRYSREPLHIFTCCNEFCMNSSRDAKLLACDACHYDICEPCYKRAMEDAPRCRSALKHSCISEHGELKCTACHKKKVGPFWTCKKDACNFIVCFDCFSKEPVKCQYRHFLELDTLEYLCMFCDRNEDPKNRKPPMPCIKCSVVDCDFRMCLNCVNESKYNRCLQGHWVRKITHRFESKMPCTYCAKELKNIVSCL